VPSLMLVAFSEAIFGGCDECYWQCCRGRELAKLIAWSTARQ
jgi:hypothetical protein